MTVPASGKLRAISEEMHAKDSTLSLEQRKSLSAITTTIIAIITIIITITIITVISIAIIMTISIIITITIITTIIITLITITIIPIISITIIMTISIIITITIITTIITLTILTIIITAWYPQEVEEEINIRCGFYWQREKVERMSKMEKEKKKL